MRSLRRRNCTLLFAITLLGFLTGCAIHMPTKETSGIFTVLRSDLSSEDAIELQAEANRAIESIVGYLDLKRPPTPATILLFNSGWSRWRYLRKTCPRLSHAKAATIETKPGEYTIILSKPWTQAELLRTLRHELTHFVIASNFNDIPPWLDEGLALFFELPPPYEAPHPKCFQLLRKRLGKNDHGLLDALVRIPVGECPTRKQYPQAWGLTWFLLTNTRFGKDRVRQYMDNVVAHKDSIEQFKQYFDAAPNDLEPLWRKAVLDHP